MLSHVQLFVTPWTVAHWAPLSMGFSRPCPPPGDPPNPGVELRSPTLQADSLPSEPPGKRGMGKCWLALPGHTLRTLISLLCPPTHLSSLVPGSPLLADPHHPTAPGRIYKGRLSRSPLRKGVHSKGRPFIQNSHTHQRLQIWILKVLSSKIC